MKTRLHGFLLIVTFVLSIIGNLFAQNIEKVSKWPKGITYEIFVRSFADSNGDGIGDIRGITSKLDYLKDIGVEGIWLMPINPSPSYHKYDVTNYYDIDPDYGTMDDFKELIKEAHERNIKVIMDLVLNHSSRANLWFQEALKDENSKYWDYYVWTNKNDPQTHVTKKNISENSKVRSHWNKVEGSDYLYFSHFGSGMPDLNYDNPKLREEVFKIGKFWLADIGVDGFRLDAAMHIFPEERAIDNHKWWEYFRSEMKSVKEDVYLVGEVWAPVDVVGPYLKGLPALFNFDMGGKIISAVNEEKGDQLAIEHKNREDYYKTINPDYIDATFLTNHDQERILSRVNNNIEKAKMAAALLFTLPGSPYMYYGEEIGMLGKKLDQHIREPFIWDTKDKDKYRTSWMQPRFSTDSTVVPLSEQLKDSNSIFNHYKKLIHLRNTSFALTYGEIIPVSFNEPSICAFLRSDKRESVLVIHNLSNVGLKLKLPENLQGYRQIVFVNKTSHLDDNQIEISGLSTLVLGNSSPKY